MFKKFKPYLCWGSAVRQTAIEKENEKRQENTSNLYNVEVENVKVDETYLPSDESSKRNNAAIEITKTGIMDICERDALMRCRKQIIADLDVTYIIDFLIANNVVDNQAQEAINSMSTTEDRTRRLLEILPNRGSQAFTLFVEALREDYDWLADTLEEEAATNHYEIDSRIIAKSSDKCLYENKFNSLQEDNVQDEQKIKNLLMVGGVPSRPSHYVPRNDILSALKCSLKSLEPGHYVALHGMPVAGKSVLAAEAVRDPEITLQFFPDGIFWFRVGIIESKEKLLNRLKILCEKLDAQSVPSSVEHAQEILRRLFLSEQYRKSLLILSDVWSPDIPVAFATCCCRILLTTRDISILDPIPRHHTSVIEVPSGLKEEESLKLFSSYVEVDPEYLPEEAKLIHEECKGSPMVIAMFGGMIGEGVMKKGKFGNQLSVQRSRDFQQRWAYYLESLRSRRYSKFRKQSSQQRSSLIEAIMVSVDNLNETLQQRYKELAVFLDDKSVPKKFRRRIPIGNSKDSKDDSTGLGRKNDIKIGGKFDGDSNGHVYRHKNYRQIFLPLQVLMTYWDMNSIEVDNVMTELVKKSLASSEFDQSLESDVYSIHVLLLDYLKTQLNIDEEKNLHKKLLNQYFRKVNFQYGKLEDDSYIFSNLGYHLIKSGQLELFPAIYLNLSFVEAMLRSSLCSSVDLLNDYKRYEEYIIGPNEENIDQLQDFEEFTRTIGGYVNSQRCSDSDDNSDFTSDIIQLALKEPPESTVHKEAIVIARQRPERLYLDWINKDITRSYHKATILHHGSVQAACFLPDMTKLLTTNGDGQIKIWNVTSGEVCHRFTGHRSCVKAMSLSPDGEWFVSGSEDGEIKIWDLGTFRDESDNGHEKQQEILRTGSVKKGSKSYDVVDGSGSPPRGENLRVKSHLQTVNQFITTDHHDLKDLSNKSFSFNELHDEMILSVGFSPDGTEVVVAGQSGAVKIFNLEARGLRLTLTTHKEPVNVCKFSSKGETICTGSDDATVRIWKSTNGHFLGSINLHGLRVLDVEFVHDTQKVVSLSADKLICWNDPTIPSQNDSSCGQVYNYTSQDAFSSIPNSDFGVLEFKRTRLADFICMKVGNEGHDTNDLALLAAGTVDNIITIWDFESAQILLSLPGHSSFIQALDFNDDDSFLLSGSVDETVMIWSLESLYEENQGASLESLSSLSLGPVLDVQFLPFGNDDSIGERNFDRNHHDILYNDTKYTVRMVTPDDSNCIRVLDNGSTIFKSPSEGGNMISCVSLSSDGRAIGYGTENGSVRLYRPWTGSIKTMGFHKTNVTCVLLLGEELTNKHFANRMNDGHGYVVMSGDKKGEVKIWWDGGSAITCSLTHLSSVRELRVFAAKDSPSTVISRCWVGSLRIWDVRNGKCIGSFEYPRAKTKIFSTCMDVSEKASLIALGTAYGGTTIISKMTLEILNEVVPSIEEKQVPVRVCRFSPDGKMLAKGHDNGSIQILEAGDDWRKLFPPLKLHESWVRDIRFNVNDSSALVTAGDSIAWWNLDLLPSLRGKKSTANSGGNTTGRRRMSSTGAGLFTRRPRKESEGESSSPNRSRNSWTPSPGSKSSSPKINTKAQPIQTPSPLSDSSSSRRRSSIALSSPNSCNKSITKIGSVESCQALLQQFNIKGSSTVDRIFASEDFKQFAALDDAGLAYILKEVDVPTLFR